MGPIYLLEKGTEIKSDNQMSKLVQISQLWGRQKGFDLRVAVIDTPDENHLRIADESGCVDFCPPGRCPVVPGDSVTLENCKAKVKSNGCGIVVHLMRDVGVMTKLEARVDHVTDPDYGEIIPLQRKRKNRRKNDKEANKGVKEEGKVRSEEKKPENESE